MIDINNYQIQTTREQRWQVYLEKMENQGEMTRKELKKWKDVFWEESGTWGHIGWDPRFRLHSNATLAGWQHFFDHELTDYQLSDKDFKQLQKYFFDSLMTSCGFTVEDGLYFFKVAFGEVYDPNRKFCLRINQEADCRTVTLTPEYVVGELISDCSFYIDNQYGDRPGIKSLLMYDPSMFKFLESVIPYVDPMGYSVVSFYELRDKGSNAMMYSEQFHRILKFSLAPPYGAYTQDRHDLAKRIADIFLTHPNKPLEWPETLAHYQAEADEMAKQMQSGEWWVIDTGEEDEDE